MNGKGNVVIIEGVGGSSNNQKRVAGFKKALEAFPNIKLLASQPGNFQRALALQVTENLLQAHRQIDGILAANDAMALGAVEALDAANRKALVIGLNGTKEAIDAVKAGKLLATGDCDGFLQGCMGVMGAVRHLRNMPVPKKSSSRSKYSTTRISRAPMFRMNLECVRRGNRLLRSRGFHD
jgi:ribose transport system substrate-binding protein